MQKNYGHKTYSLKLGTVVSILTQSDTQWPRERTTKKHEVNKKKLYHTLLIDCKGGSSNIDKGMPEAYLPDLDPGGNKGYQSLWNSIPKSK
jgi:hypothetical protein